MNCPNVGSKLPTYSMQASSRLDVKTAGVLTYYFVGFLIPLLAGFGTTTYLCRISEDLPAGRQGFDLPFCFQIPLRL